MRVTQANYVYAGEVVSSHLRLTPEDRVLTVLPLFHANAQYYTTMSSLVSGATLILSRRFSASRFVDQARRHGVTVASLFAAPIRMILSNEPLPEWREHCLRVVLFAQNLTPEEHARWDKAIAAPLVQLYGMTETIGPPLVNPLNAARNDTVGRPTLGYTCRIVSDDGRAARTGEVGELHVQGVPGVSLMRGYLDDAKATDAVLRNGWLATGDLVRVDEEGYVSFVDRNGDMIKRAGENVAASEVERVLRAHMHVADAAVFGVPDPMYDNELIAAVVPRDGAPLDTLAVDVHAWCKERLARFRVPKEILVLPELPRTAVGKVQKHVLRELWSSDSEGS